LSVLMNDGKGRLQEPVTYEHDRGEEMFPTGVFVGELTGDGLVDLAVTWSQPSWSSANGLISILKNTGGGTFELFKDIKPGFTLSAIQGADIDHNGLIDLAVTSLYADTVRILLQQEPGEFLILDPIKVGFAPVGVAIQDMNGDDQSDLVVVNRDSNSLSLFIGNGKGFFTTVGHFGVGATPAAVVLYDFDQDNLPDLATASTNVDGVSVLLSGGGAIPLPSMSTEALLFEQDSRSSPLAMQSPQQVRFSNIGLGLLRIDKIEISGTGAGAFAVMDNTCQDTTLHTGEFCTMQVGFASQDSGTHHATLIIQDNASGSPRQVTLKGIIKG
ncbi:MAG: FG-GAP-like repeat-containing protein, partial [Nitrospirota bacterium]|nr:FG-GAP-like repeat-containing protein [Nitrospirota bacterium]